MSEITSTCDVNETSSLAARRHQPTLPEIITVMQQKIWPILPLPDGPAHPAYPNTLMQWYLLTEAQMDNIASYYHQRPFTPTSILPPFAELQHFPSIWKTAYPGQMDWDDDFFLYVGEVLGVESRAMIKRRKIGKFIGLLECLTPTAETEARERWERNRERLQIKADDFLFMGGRRGNWN